MKKTLKSGLSLLICITMVLSITLASPLKSFASGATQQLHLRIEGASSEVFAGEVSFTSGDNVTTILNSLYAAGKISKPNYKYGFLSSLGDGSDNGRDIIPSGNNTYIEFYHNDESSSSGSDAVFPSDGDSIVLALVGYDTDTYLDITCYPVITVSPASPEIGQNVTVHVKAYRNDNYEGAVVTFNGNVVGSTDASGNLTVTMPVATGTYNLQVSDDQLHSFPLLVRTGNIPITVVAPGTPPAQPTHNDFTIANNAPVTFNTSLSSDNSERYTYLPSGYSSTYRDENSHVYQLNIPSDTTLSGSPAWDGTLISPSPVYNILVPNGSTRMAVLIGSSKLDLALSNFATLTLPLQSGKKAGFLDASGTFHDIPELLTNAAPSSGDDGYFDDTVNNALIVYTKHFSTFVAYLPASNISVTDTLVDSSIVSASAFLSKRDSSDWTALALTRAGFPAPADYLSSVASSLGDNSGDFGGAAPLAKTVIALRAAGANPCGFNGYNLVEKLYDYQGLEKSTLNGPIYMLLALDSGKYSIPASALWNDQKLVSLILGCQKSDGSFALASGSAGDPDITAMAITALAPHLAESGVTDAVNAAVGFLSSNQTADGGFIPSGSSNEASETVSQAIIALNSVGIDAATDLRFVKNGKSLLDNLIGYENADGGFRHTLSNDDSDIIATQQALMALDAYRRFEQYQPRLFDLSATGYSITSANPQTSSEDITPVFITAAFMLVLIALATLKRRRRA